MPAAPADRATTRTRSMPAIEKAPKDGEGRVLSLDLLTCELFRDGSSAAAPTPGPSESKCRTTHSRSLLTRQAARLGTLTR